LRKQNEKVTPQEFVQKILVASAKHPALIGEVLVGSPAEAAGIKAGELLTAIDGKPTEGKLLIDISGLVSEGKEGSTVELTLTSQDPASPTDPSKTVTRKVLVTRKHFQQKVVRFKDLGQSIAYISASEFNNTLEAEYEEAIKKVVDGNFQMLVIDMRDNGGGLVNAAKSLIEFTMASGYVVTEQHREGDKLERHALYLSREAKLTTNPAIVQGKIEAHVEQRKLLLPESVIIVVLTNNGTASSAELFTRALKANGRAETLGEPTFGKGIEQSVMTMAGRELRVTSAYFEPGDEWTNALPIEPTTLVKADPEKGDVQLEAAKKRLLELKARGEADRQKLKEALERQKETWSKAKH
jgi:carboxyl-terminal processing protease